jgi:predicted amidohydrolase
MRAGYLQFEPEFGKPDVNVSKIRNLVSDKEFDLLVVPELANSGYFFTSKDELHDLSEEIPKGKFCNAMMDISAEKNGFIVAGVCEKVGDKFYNSSILVQPDGQVFTYRKIQLFDEEKLWFEPGDMPLQVFEIGNYKFGKVNIGMMICFDWIFPEVARTLALKGAKIICHPSNLVLAYCQDAMVTRAIENRVFTITANRIGKDVKGDRELSFTGMSEIVNPKAVILHRGTPDKEECVVVEIDPEEASDKNVTPMNNVFEDRREELYFR